MPNVQTVYPGPKPPHRQKVCRCCGYQCCPPPPCRICSVNVALAAFLIGLVVAGIGAAVAAFQWHEEFVTGICMFMVVGGFLAMVGASGLFIWDRMQLYKSIRLGDPSLYVCDLRSSLRRSGSFSNPQKLDAADLPQNNVTQVPPPSYDSLHPNVTAETNVKQLEYHKNSTVASDQKSVKSVQSSRISGELPVAKTSKTPAQPAYDTDSLTTISYSIPKQFLPKNFQQQQQTTSAHKYASQPQRNVVSQVPSQSKVVQKQLMSQRSDESLNQSKKSSNSVSTDV